MGKNRRSLKEGLNLPVNSEIFAVSTPVISEFFDFSKKRAESILLLTKNSLSILGLRLRRAREKSQKNEWNSGKVFVHTSAKRPSSTFYRAVIENNKIL